MKALTIVRSCALFGLVVANAFTPTPAHAQSAEEIAKTLQDPLASISALMTDNTIAFNTGEPEETTGYNFQLQPVYSVAAKTFNLIPRAVIPIIGAPGGAVVESDRLLTRQHARRRAVAVERPPSNRADNSRSR